MIDHMGLRRMMGRAPLKPEWQKELEAAAVAALPELLDENIALKAKVAELQKRDNILAALEAGGVDNWPNYYDSLVIAGLE